MKIFDNIVKKSSADQIENFLLNQDFPWFLVKNSSGNAKKVEGFSDTLQFEHHFVMNDEIHSQAIHPIMNMLDWNNILKRTKVSPNILRMKSNLLLKTQPTPNTPHIDFSIQHSVLLYYVNDSSGDTIFYDDNFKIKQTIKPKKGRIVIFDGDIYHSSTPPQTNDYRCVINFNLKPISHL